MSSSVYSSYRISERERQRLEKERRQKLEEERKRLKEEKRKRMIAEEKERIEIIKRFREAASTLQATSRELNRITEAPPQINTNDKEQKELNKFMKETIQSIKRQLKNVPPEWSRVFHNDLAQISQTVAEIERHSCDPYYLHQLKWVQRNLIRLISEDHKKIEALEKALQEIDELIIQMEIVKNNAIIEEHRRDARLLINVLSDLTRLVNPDYVSDRLPELKNKAAQLYEDFEETQTRNKTRRFVLQNVREVLLEMGYEVLGAEIPGDNAQPTYLTFKTPDSEITKMFMGLDNSIFAEFAHLAGKNKNGGSISREVLIFKCRRWCEDYNLLQKKLMERDININDKWHTVPEEGRFEAIYVKSQNDGPYEKELTEEDYFLQNASQGELMYAKK